MPLLIAASIAGAAIQNRPDWAEEQRTASAGVDSKGRRVPTDDDTNTVCKEASVTLDIGLVADLQGQLLAASADLERLTELLSDAAARLMASFSTAYRHVEHRATTDRGAASDNGALLREELTKAMSALQFPDMATQTIEHAVSRIRAVALTLGNAFDDDDGVPESVRLVERACPVTQQQMSTGSVELF